jgi:serine/threonine protein kinase
MEGYPAIGSVVAGRYRIDALLGEGGMGAVFRASDVQPGHDGRQVALKFVAAEMRNRPGIASRFANEAVAASKIASEHAVQILGVEATEDGTPFIVMELLEGKDLDSIIETEAPLDAERAVHFALQILRALQVAHGAGVIHRDLKPGNVYVVSHDGDKDWVKLIDFGIGKILGDETSQLTKTSTTLGTPAYMSPEQAKSAKGADARSDLYSVGVILYELLTKKRPFEGDSHNEIVVKICTEPPVPLRSHRTDLPSKLVAAVERALVKAPSGRYGSAIEFALALAPVSGKRSAGVLARIEGTSTNLPAAPLPTGVVGSTAVKIAGAPSSTAQKPSAAASSAPSALKGSTAGMDDLAHSSTEPNVAHPDRAAAASFAMANAQTAPVPQQQPIAQAAAQPPPRGEEKTLLGEPGPMNFGTTEGSRGGTEKALPIAPAADAYAPTPPAAASPYASPPQAFVPPSYSQGPYSDDEPESRRGGSSGLMAVLAILALGLIGSGIYFAVASSSSRAAPGSTVEATDEGDDQGGGAETTAKKKKKPTKPGQTTADDDDVPTPGTITTATTKPTVKPKPSTTTSTKPSTTTTPSTTPSTTTTTTTTTPSTTPTGFPFPFPFPTKPTATATTPPPPPPTTTTPPTATTPPPPPTSTIITIPTGTTPPPPPTVTAPPTATTPPPSTTIIKPKIGGA